MKIEVAIEFDTNDDWTEEEVAQYDYIFRRIKEKKAFTGVRGGSANVHFGKEGLKDFKGIEYSYWGWREPA